MFSFYFKNKMNATQEYSASHLDDDIIIEKNQNGTETYIFDPYNPLNKSIDEIDIQNILKNYGINTPIHNVNLYKRAFIHRSYMKRPNLENTQNNIVIVPKPDDCLPLYTKSNERLEFVGDGVLECITKYYLYRRFPKENEGFMTEKKIALVKNESIGKMALEMGLHKWYILSKHAELKQTRTNLKKLGCLFKVTPHYMEVEDHNVESGYYMGVYLCLGQPIHNKKHGESIPITNFNSYSEIHQYMSEYNKIFVFLGEGKHKIKKKAEQIACDEAIRHLHTF